MSYGSDATQVYDADGGIGPKIPIGDATWLDASHMVGIDASRSSIAALVFDISTGVSSSISLPHQAFYALSNGHGAVAFTWPRDDQWPDTHWSYIVWSDGSKTATHDGYPQTWSPDGSKLALMHAFGRVRSPGGWVEIASWPGLDSMYVGGPPFATGDVSFSPSSQFAEFATQLGEGVATDKHVVRIVHLNEDATVDVEADNYSDETWTIDDALTVTNLDRTATTYASNGDTIDSFSVVGSAAAGSLSGVTAAFWSVDVGNKLQVVQNGKSMTLTFVSESTRAVVSPDGSRVIVGMDGNVYLQVL